MAELLKNIVFRYKNLKDKRHKIKEAPGWELCLLIVSCDRSVGEKGIIKTKYFHGWPTERDICS